MPSLPEKFNHFRSELGRELYGPSGYAIDRSNKEGYWQAILRNYEFFGAPVIAVITQDPPLSTADARSVGMYLRTSVLARTEQGLGTCMMVSVTGYPEALQRESDTDLETLCRVTIGWHDTLSNINNLIIAREKIEEIFR